MGNRPIECNNHIGLSHKKEDGGITYCCTQCSFTSFDSQQLRAHSDQQHRPPRLNSCTERVFVSDEAMPQPVERHLVSNNQHLAAEGQIGRCAGSLTSDSLAEAYPKQGNAARIDTSHFELDSYRRPSSKPALGSPCGAAPQPPLDKPKHLRSKPSLPGQAAGSRGSLADPKPFQDKPALIDVSHFETPKHQLIRSKPALVSAQPPLAQTADVFPPTNLISHGVQPLPAKTAGTVHVESPNNPLFLPHIEPGFGNPSSNGHFMQRSKPNLPRETAPHPDADTRCRICQNQYKTSAGLAAHQKLVHGSPRCPVCKKTSSKEFVITHVHKVHNHNVRCFVCPKCSFTTLLKPALTIHDYALHRIDGFPFACPICPRTANKIKSVRSLLNHTSDQHKVIYSMVMNGY